jgi:hemerythrin
MRKTSDIIWQDVQHQALFDILESIAGPEPEEGILQQLVDYTERHFSLEEQYMRQLDYPGREAHVRAHNRFRAEIEGLLGQQAEQDAQFRQLISTFLTEWLTRHVFGIDKELEAFLLARSEK